MTTRLRAWPAAPGVRVVSGSRTFGTWHATLDRFPGFLFFGQLAAAGLLGLAHAVVTWSPPASFHPLLLRLFDVDHEMNLPTWFASSQWLLLAAVLVATACVCDSAGPRRVWIAAALGAGYFSADEVAIFHERLGTVFEEFLSSLPSGSALQSLLGFRSYYWPLVYAPILVPAGIVLCAVVWRHLGPARRTVLLGVFVFVYAALGLDLIEGRFGTPSHGRIPVELPSGTFLFDIFLLEEMLEMVGVALITLGFSRYCIARILNHVPER